MTDKKDDALKLALAALEHEAEIGNDDAYRTERDAIREALAEQPAQRLVVAHHAPCQGMNCGITRTDQEHSLECQAEHAAAIAGGQFVKPAQQQEPEPDRVKFELHWRKTRGEKKANRELPRHPLQPQTYIQDSANRHWVTWQAAVRSVFPPASKPLTMQERTSIVRANKSFHDKNEIDAYGIIDDVEAAHGIKE